MKILQFFFRASCARYARRISQSAETQALDLQAGVWAGHAIQQDPLTPVTVLFTGKIIRTINAMNRRILLLF